MKKIFIIFISLILLYGCGKKDEMPRLYPTDLLTAEDISVLIENQYDIVLEDDAIKEKDNVISATYVSSPLGVGDSVKISVMYPDEAYENTYDCFKKSMNKRTDSITVKGLAKEAYITFPTLHIYQDSYYITVTAGSGSSDAQATILTEIGKTVMSNYNRYLTTASSK